MRKLTYVGTLLSHFVQFAKQNKAYWIVPVIIIFGLTSIFVIASQTVAPFIYTLF